MLRALAKVNLGAHIKATGGKGTIISTKPALAIQLRHLVPRIGVEEGGGGAVSKVTAMKAATLQRRQRKCSIDVGTDVAANETKDFVQLEMPNSYEAEKGENAVETAGGLSARLRICCRQYGDQYEQ